MQVKLRNGDVNIYGSLQGVTKSTLGRLYGTKKLKLLINLSSNFLFLSRWHRMYIY